MSKPKTYEAVLEVAADLEDFLSNPPSWLKETIEAAPVTDRPALLYAGKPIILAAVREHGWKMVSDYKPLTMEVISAWLASCQYGGGQFVDSHDRHEEEQKWQRSLDKEWEDIKALPALIRAYASLGKQQIFDIFEATYSPYLRQNSMTLEASLKFPSDWLSRFDPPGQTFSKGTDLLAEWESKMGLSVSDMAHFQRQWDRMIEGVSYSPVVELFDNLRPVSTEEILETKATLVANIFGKPKDHDDYPLDTELLWHWLLSVVARSYEPGCAVRQALVLFSKTQGTGKQTFFTAMGLGRTLTGNCQGYYARYPLTANEREATHNRVGSIVRELEEIENYTSRRSMSDLRGLLTSRTFTYDRKYLAEVTINDYGVWGVSTNSSEIYNDPAGTTRYGTIHALEHHRSIDNLWLENNIRSIYAAVVSEYKSRKEAGEINFWLLPCGLSDLSEARNKKYTFSSPYADLATQAITGLERSMDKAPAFKITDLYKVIEMPLRDRAGISEVKAILEALGYGEGAVRVVWGRTETKVLKRWHKQGASKGYEDVSANSLLEAMRSV